MSYVVYANHPTDKAFVHEADCWRSVKRKATCTENGYWADGFGTREQALAFARGTGKRNVRAAKCCDA